MHPRRALVALVALTVALSGCDLDLKESDGEQAEAAPPRLVACHLVPADESPQDDLIRRGLARAEDDLGIEEHSIDLEDETSTVRRGCELIVVAGEPPEPPASGGRAVTVITTSTAEERLTDREDVVRLQLDLGPGAFLAGYVAAAHSGSGTVGAFAGVRSADTVSILTGFRAGIEHYNETNGGGVRIAGDGRGRFLFTGSMSDPAAAEAATSGLSAEGADVILAVVGPGLAGAAEAAATAEVALIAAGYDGCVSLPEACPVFLTSIRRNVHNAVFESVKLLLAGDLEGGTYMGGLHDRAVDLAPFHHFREEVPKGLRQEVEDLTRELILGELPRS